MLNTVISTAFVDQFSCEKSVVMLRNIETVIHWTQ